MSEGLKTDTTDSVRLTLPASPEWLALARTTGAAIASRWSFTYDEIADLRLAIDELCLTLIEPGAADRLEILYSFDADAITVTGVVSGAAEKRPGTVNGEQIPDESADGSMGSGELSGRILDALVDAHGSDADGSGRQAWLRKRRSVTGA